MRRLVRWVAEISLSLGRFGRLYELATILKIFDVPDEDLATAEQRKAQRMRRYL